jgi:hypothetical protein
MKNRVLETLLQAEETVEPNGSTRTSTLLELITEGRPPNANPVGVIVGKFVGFNAAGDPLVNFVADIDRQDIVARSTITLREDQVGSDVVLSFEHGDLAKPIVIGSLWQPNSSTREPLVAELDGERITLTAEKEIVLRCGKASITLTQAGKILIRGAYLSSQSSGMNRIKGGSVQIN